MKIVSARWRSCHVFSQIQCKGTGSRWILILNLSVSKKYQEAKKSSSSVVLVHFTGLCYRKPCLRYKIKPESFDQCHRRHPQLSSWSVSSTRWSPSPAARSWCSTWRRSTPSATESKPRRSFSGQRRTTSSWFGPPIRSPGCSSSRSGFYCWWCRSWRIESSRASSPRGARSSMFSWDSGGVTLSGGWRTSLGIGSGRQLATSFWPSLGFSSLFTLGEKSTIKPLSLHLYLQLACFFVYQVCPPLITEKYNWATRVCASLFQSSFLLKKEWKRK